MFFKSFLLSFTITIALPCFSQSIQGDWGSNNVEEFGGAFEQALQENFSEEALNQLFKEYTPLLSPHNNTTQFLNTLTKKTEEHYPLNVFRQTPLYQDNIVTLFHSSNKNHRLLLAYLVIASSGDLSFETQLLDRLQTETDKSLLQWAGMALLYLRTEQTTPLFDFVVEQLVVSKSLIEVHCKVLKNQLYRQRFLILPQIHTCNRPINSLY
ncbi:MAG: hypothetical protein ACRBFS_16490 [Aureispira sp.]